MEQTFHLAEHLAFEWTQWLSRYYIREARFLHKDG